MRHQLRPRFRRRFKLRVAIAVRLLAIGLRKTRPSRAHIPRHVLDDLRNGVHLRIESRGQIGIGDLCHRAFA